MVRDVDSLQTVTDEKLKQADMEYLVSARRR
jgi:hypothetical protein